MNINMLKKLDAVVGYFSASVLSVPESVQLLPQVASILIIRPGGIGDAVLLASTINSLKSRYPGLGITILAEQRNASVFSLIPNVDTVLCYDRPCEFFRALRGRYDVVIDTEQWYRLSAVVARLVRSSIKIGFGTNERRRMFTHRVPYDQNAYEADNFLALLKPLGIDCHLESETPGLTVPPEAVSRASQLLQSLATGSFVAIFPGASIPEKRWGADRFRLVVEALSALGINIVVVGGKEDRQQGEAIVSGGLGLNLAGLTSLPETAAVIQKSALLLSGDSGVLHIAVGLRVPTVSLFGPGRVEKWAPRGEKHVVINKGLPCSPCTFYGNTPSCPIDAKCMKDITVYEVVNAVKMLLSCRNKAGSVVVPEA